MAPFRAKKYGKKFTLYIQLNKGRGHGQKKATIPVAFYSLNSIIVGSVFHPKAAWRREEVQAGCFLF
jgi:hypothetical protein